MSAPQEREAKLKILTVAGFEKLCSLPAPAGKSEPEEQLNHYFDTESLELIGQRLLLRIRTGRGHVLTLKCGREVSPGFFESLELESEIPESLLKSALENPSRLYAHKAESISELCRRVGKPKLQHVGTLRNERHRRLLDDCLLEIDRLTFPDGTPTYEIEMETETGGARDHVERLLKTLRETGVEVEPQRQTKMEQFVEWLRAQG